MRQAEPEKPVLFLAVGNEPALPLDRLEAMDDSSIKALFESLKKKSGDDGAEDEEEVEEADDDTEESEEEPVGNESDGDEEEIESEGEEARRRATQWAMRACEVAGLVRRLRNPTPERELRHRKELESFANKLSRRVILPGEWYLVRWGGTRKGSGILHQTTVGCPNCSRTLRPLAYRDVQPDDPLNAAKTPRLPEEILSEKVCDPGCGSGSFLVGSLKYLTDALYESLNVHGRLTDEWQQRPLPEILGVSSGGEEESLSAERLPCRPEDFDLSPG